MLNATTDDATSLGYHVVHSCQTDDWHVLDPVGGAICRAVTRTRAEELARLMARLHAERAVHLEC
jgi:hypothetical protein